VLPFGLLIDSVAVAAKDDLVVTVDRPFEPSGACVLDQLDCVSGSSGRRSQWPQLPAPAQDGLR
jgi:hypothetical protein